MRKVILGAIVLIFALLLTACGGGNEENTSSDAQSNNNEAESNEASDGSSEGLTEPVELSWVTGSQGGVWYGAGGGFASLLKEYDDNFNIKAIPGGTVQNIALVDEGEADIAWNMAFFANQALEGSEPFKQERSNISAIASGLGDSTFHFVIAADHEYESLEEIFEKGNIKIAITPPSGSDDYIFQTMMEFYDTSYEDMEANGVDFFHGSYAEQAEQFKNSNVDAIFALSGLPGSSITDASISRDLRLLEFPDDLISHLEEHSFPEKTIPAGTYEKAVNGDEDIKVATAPNVILVNNELPENVVYEMVKGLNENEDRFTSVHAAMDYYDKEEAANNLGQVPLHPGAEKYYKEIGVIE
ncbi:TAXI family TRAP transporter solute-binding subunit [Virgibacillus sp. W0181]|uniref:TAXI family TRAP transporter solute-binding subunit n=1 Tax=Virgibacillus sp. W0181 TaxID=3391581 RepID=UPI003F45607E